MNFDWTEQEQKLRDDLSALFDEDTRADLAALETARPDELRTTILQTLKRLAPTGYLSVAAQGDGLAEAVRLVAGAEEVANVSGDLFLATEASTRLFANLVAAHGNDAVKSALLDPVRSGTILGAVGLADGASEDGAEVGLTVTREGDRFQLNGRKGFLTNGPIADWVALSAELDGSTVVALVKTDSSGFIRGPRMDTLGFRGLAVCAIQLEDCEVDADHLLGLDGGVDLDGLRQLEDLILCVASLGLMYRAFEGAKAHANTHQRGGKPLMGYQEIRYKLAEMLTLHQTSQLFVYRAAYLLSDADGPDAFDAPTVVRSAKVFTAEAAEQIASAAAQILAGQGFTSGNPVEQAYRDAKYFGVAGTTSEVARMAIADELLERNPI